MGEQQSRDESSPGTPVEVAPVTEGGDSACWLHRLCDSCGALLEAAPGTPCWRCGSDPEG